MQTPLLAALLIALAVVGNAFAVEKITYPTRIGQVVFPHKKHQDALGECRGCHEKGPGKIDGFNKVMAHGKGCKGCHEELKIGPTRCGDCHKNN